MKAFCPSQFEDYIAYRHQLGYDTKGLQWVLEPSTAICSKKKAEPTDLTPAFFLTLQAGLQTQSQIRQPPAVHHPHVL